MKPPDTALQPSDGRDEVERCSQSNFGRLGATVHIKSHMDTLTRSKPWQEFLEVILGLPLTIGYI